MKKKRNLYIIAFLCFITLVGVTIAYLQSTDVFENIFNAGTYSVVTHEEFTSPDNWKPGDETPKTIITTNEGTIPIRVRVKLEESWTSKNGGNLVLTFLNDGSRENVSLIIFDNEQDWILKNGYYYYLHELEPGDSTTTLIKSVTFNPNYSGDITCTYNSETNSNECISSEDKYMGGKYILSITTETVQADFYQNVWDYTPIINDYIGDNPCTYDGDLEIGAEYVNGSYTYRYRQEWGGSSGVWESTSDLGWGVKLTDLDSTTPVTSTFCSSINNKPIVSISNMFLRSKATSVDLSSFDTSNVTNMKYLFATSDITSLDLSSFDTSNVIDMHGMFFGSKATFIDVESFNTKNVLDMSTMFSSIKLSTLDLSNFDTSNVTNMQTMFSGALMTSYNLSSFDTGKVTNMAGMFQLCKATTLDLSSFDTSNVMGIGLLFNSASTRTVYCKTQDDCDKFNSSSRKPSTLTFVVKES